MFGAVPATLSIGPVGEPVTVNEVRDALNIGHTSENPKIERGITSARTYLEGVLRRWFLTQTWVENWPRFPFELWLTRWPVQSITQIDYLDPDGVSQTLAASVYQENLVAQPARIREALGQSWPSIVLDTYNPVTVTYVVGFGDAAADVPTTDKELIVRLAAHWHLNPDSVAGSDVGTEIAQTLKALIAHDRNWSNI
jgi:uncharacterized phiE125 gp8 family phage protein